MTNTEKRWADYSLRRKAIQQERWAAHHKIDAEADAKINELARELFAPVSEVRREAA